MPEQSQSQRDGSNGSEDGNVTTQGVSFALIHEAASLTDYGSLSDPESLEAQVARGRGYGTVDGVIGDDDDENSGNTYEVKVEEGRLKTNTGYVVRFVEEGMLDLPAFDVAALDSVKAYPAPEPMIESLTPRIRGHLKEHGYVKVRGAYSPDDSRFYGVQMGWDVSDEVDPWDRLMEVIDQVSTTPAALDYVFVTEGPDRWDVEEIARVRGVKPSSIRGNVRAVENELDT